MEPNDRSVKLFLIIAPHSLPPDHFRSTGAIPHMADMKATIKAVSIDLFFKKGYFATSISDIAKGSGIQKASIYYHYASKEDLLYHILTSTMDDLTMYLNRRLAAVANVEPRMRSAVRGHVRFHLERQKENFIANSELRGLTREHYRSIVQQRDEYERIFQDLIRQGAEEKVFADGDVKILSYAILTLCTAGATWFNSDGRLTVGEIADIYETFIISGLKQGKLDVQ